MKKFISIVLCVVIAVSVWNLGLTAQAKTFTEGDYKYTVLSSGNIQIKKYIGNDIDLIVPEKINNHQVKEIGKAAFSGFEGNSVLLPEGITDIYYQAFAGSPLNNIKLPDSLLNIDTSAFEGCINLSSITIPSDVKKIGTRAFYGCECLSEVILGDCISEIGENAFSDTLLYNSDSMWENKILYIENYLIYIRNYSDDTLKIKDGTIGIATGATDNCKTVTSIIFPESLRFLSENWLSEEVALEKVIVNKNNNYFKGVKGVLFNKDKTTLICYPSHKTGKVYRIPKGVKKIGPYAFLNSKLSKVYLPNGVKTIGYKSFYNCKKIKTVLVPKTVKNIGIAAFGVLKWLSRSDWESYDYKKSGFVLKGYKNSSAKKYSEKAYIGRDDEWKSIDFTQIDLSVPKVRITTGSGKITINYKKVKKAEGFQVKYTKGKKSYTKSFKTKKSVTKTINNLQKGKYQVKIRAFYIVDGVKIYSKWTKTKTVKVN